MRIQQQSLEAFDKVERQRGAFQAYLAKRLNYDVSDIENGKKSLFVDSDNFHQQVERKELLDLALSLNEKYNPTKAWIYDLRSTYKDPEKKGGRRTMSQDGIAVAEGSGKKLDGMGLSEVDPVYQRVVAHYTSINDTVSDPNNVPFSHFTKFDDRTKRITISRKTVRNPISQTLNEA